MSDSVAAEERRATTSIVQGQSLNRQRELFLTYNLFTSIRQNVLREEEIKHNFLEYFLQSCNERHEIYKIIFS